MEAMNLMTSCVETKIARTLELANEEIAFQASVRKSVAKRLENYTCIDENLDTTGDLETLLWDNNDGVTRTVHVKHDRPASRIHVVEDFITEEECKAMEESAAKSLHRATVADGKGGSQYSENRKAMQAGIKVKWDKEHEGEGMDFHIARLSRRVYDYTNHVLGLGERRYLAYFMSVSFTFTLTFNHASSDSRHQRAWPGRLDVNPILWTWIE